MSAANPPHEFLYIYSMPEKYQNENQKAKKIKPQKALILCGFPPARPAPRDTKNRKRMRKKNCTPRAARKSHHRDTKPQPAVRSVRRGWGGCTHYCIHKAAACSCWQGCNQGYTQKKNKKNVHTTVYTTNQIVYILPYTMPYGLCTHYPAHREADCVHTTVYKKKDKKEEQKRQTRVYTNGMVLRLREQAKQVQARVYKNERRVRPREQEGGSRLGCTKIKKNCTPLVG